MDFFFQNATTIFSLPQTHIFKRTTDEATNTANIVNSVSTSPSASLQQQQQQQQQDQQSHG